MITFEKRQISTNDKSIDIIRDKVIIGKIYPSSENIKTTISIFNYTLTLNEMEALVYEMRLNK